MIVNMIWYCQEGLYFHNTYYSNRRDPMRMIIGECLQKSQSGDWRPILNGMNSIAALRWRARG